MDNGILSSKTLMETVAEEYAAKRKPVTVFLLGGFQYHGYIRKVYRDGGIKLFDGTVRMIPYDAISTISPAEET